jgi:hypothetical protein
MNTQRIAPATKLRRGSEHYLNGKPVYIERDRGDGTLLISDSKQLRPEDNFWTVNKSDLKLTIKKGSSISAKPKPADEKQVKDHKDMNAFFDSLSDKIPFHCTNCRKPLYAFSKKAKRSVCAHIFPKAYFKSIATNPDNILFMGADYIGCPCPCHDYWDKNLDSRKKLTRAYDIAVKRLELLKPHMTPKEINMAYDYLGIQEGVKS